MHVLAYSQVFGGLAKWLAGYSWGRALLLRYPKLFTRGLFSKQGPSEEQMRSTGFTKTLIVHGFADATADATLDHASSSPDPTPLLPTLPNTHAVVQVKGPEPGYVATPIIMVNAALALMHARERLDVPCGVWTAGALLRKTDLLGRLQRNGVTFEVVEEPGAAGVHVPLATAHTWGKTKKKP